MLLDAPDIEDLDFALVDTTIDSIIATVLVEEPIDHMEMEVKNDVQFLGNNNLLVHRTLTEVMEFDKDALQNGKTTKNMHEKNIDEFKVQESTVSMRIKQNVIDTKRLDLPQHQGIHALVDNMETFSSKKKLELDNELVSIVPLEVCKKLLDPINVMY